LYRQGRLDDAEDTVVQAESLSAPDDAINHAYCPMVRALILARRGRLAEAEAHAREAVAKSLAMKGHVKQAAAAHEALAEVLRVSGGTNEARDEAEKALALYEGKGIVPAIENVRAFLGELAEK
jgi:tetratricopeptide (TPR) repeat protein